MNNFKSFELEVRNVGALWQTRKAVVMIDLNSKALKTVFIPFNSVLFVLCHEIQKFPSTEHRLVFLYGTKTLYCSTKDLRITFKPMEESDMFTY